jgi:hypothetical protein
LVTRITSISPVGQTNSSEKEKGKIESIPIDKIIGINEMVRIFVAARVNK